MTPKINKFRCRLHNQYLTKVISRLHNQEIKKNLIKLGHTERHYNKEMYKSCSLHTVCFVSGCSFQLLYFDYAPNISGQKFSHQWLWNQHIDSVIQPMMSKDIIIQSVTTNGLKERNILFYLPEHLFSKKIPARLYETWNSFDFCCFLLFNHWFYLTIQCWSVTQSWSNIWY